MTSDVLSPFETYISRFQRDLDDGATGSDGYSNERAMAQALGSTLFGQMKGNAFVTERTMRMVCMTVTILLQYFSTSVFPLNQLTIAN